MNLEMADPMPATMPPPPLLPPLRSLLLDAAL